MQGWSLWLDLLLTSCCAHCEKSLQGLLGGLSNVLECLRGEGAPPPAVRAVVTAALRYVDAELLNALVLRRDCCSISAIKALQVSRAWHQLQQRLWPCICSNSGRPAR